jgi:hypothetical protein
VEGTVLFRVRVVDLMVKVLIEQIRVSAAQAVAVAAPPRPTFLHHSLGSEEMMNSTVVMVAEAAMKLDIITHGLVHQAPLEVSALAGLAKSNTFERINSEQ